MKIKDIDFTKKENQTFKNWFWFCMSNLWIPIVVVSGVLLGLELAYLQTVIGWLMESYDEGIGTGLFVTPFLFIPLTIFSVTIYKGLYQHWNDVCNGRSR